MKRTFRDASLFFAFLAFGLLLWDGGHFLLWAGAWTISMVCFFFGVVLPPVVRLPKAPEDRQLPIDSEPRREWRSHPAWSGSRCAGCSAETSAGGWFSPWWYDPDHGWFEKSDARFCEPCANLREQAENLGPEGVKEQWVAGKLTSERRDEMLDYLVSEENPD